MTAASQVREQQAAAGWRADLRLAAKAEQSTIALRAQLARAEEDESTVERFELQRAALLKQQEEFAAALYLGEEVADGARRDVEADLALLDERIRAVKKVPAAVISKLKRKLHASIAEERKAKEAAQKAQFAWAEIRHAAAVQFLDTRIGSLEAALAEVAAIESFLPEPKFYPMLDYMETTVSQQYFEALSTAKRAQRPSMPKIPKWMEARSIKSLPSFSTALDYLKQEVAKMLEGGKP